MLLRSLLYALLMLVVTPVYFVLSLLSAPLPALARNRFISGWSRLMTRLAWAICGIRYQVIGREHLPRQPAVILAKHQSAWETLAFAAIFPPQAAVLKRELLLIPFFGWGLALTSPIAIDRKAGKRALKALAEQGRARLANGFWILVFPEGTRMPPGMTGQYAIGGAYLAARAGAPVVPVAHNAGECWPKNGFRKRPGLITVSIGPAIDTAGRAPAEVNAEAQAWIEAEMHRLQPAAALPPPDRSH